MPKLLIAGDPSGSHTARAIASGWLPENITVWETEERHIYAAQSIDDRIDTILDDSSLAKLNSLPIDNMKFISIGNPPYTDTSSRKGASTGGCAKTLDYPIYEILMGKSVYVSQIVRSMFTAKPNHSFRKRLFSTGKVVSIVALPETTFPTIKDTPTCILTWSEDHTGPTKVVYLDGTVKYIDLTADICLKLDNIDYNPSIANSIAYRYKRGTVKERELTENPGSVSVITSMGGYGGRMEDGVLMVDGRVGIECINQHGVVMNAVYNKSTVNNEQATGPVYVKPYEYGISSPCVILKTSSLEESEKLREYLMSVDVQRKLYACKISNANTKELFSNLEDIL